LKPGQYTMMIGAENDAVSYLRGIKLRIIWRQFKYMY
jgi:hypothetical protein